MPPEPRSATAAWSLLSVAFSMRSVPPLPPTLTVDAWATDPSTVMNATPLLIRTRLWSSGTMLGSQLSASNQLRSPVPAHSMSNSACAGMDPMATASAAAASAAGARLWRAADAEARSANRAAAASVDGTKMGRPGGVAR